MELEESTCLTSDYTTKPQSSKTILHWVSLLYSDGIGTKTDLSIYHSTLSLGIFWDKLQTPGCMYISISANLHEIVSCSLFTTLFFGYKLYIQWNIPIFFFPHSCYLFLFLNMQVLISALHQSDWFVYIYVCIYIVCVHAIFLSFFFFPDHVAGYVGLVPRPVTEPTTPAVEVWSLNHWTTRDIP